MLEQDLSLYSAGQDKEPDTMVLAEIRRLFEIGLNLPYFNGSELMKRRFLDEASEAYYLTSRFLVVPGPFVRLGSGITNSGREYWGKASLQEDVPTIHLSEDYIESQINRPGSLGEPQRNSTTAIIAHEMCHVKQAFLFPDYMEDVSKRGESMSDAEWEEVSEEKQAQSFGKIVYDARLAKLGIKRAGEQMLIFVDEAGNHLGSAIREMVDEDLDFATEVTYVLTKPYRDRKLAGFKMGSRRK